MIPDRWTTFANRTASSARLLLLAAFVFGFSGCRHSAPVAQFSGPEFRPEPAPTFRFDGVRFATINAEFLFDGIGDEGEATFPHKGNPKLSREHRTNIAGVIRMLDADLVLVVEVENLNTLELLIAESLGDLGYTPYLVDGTDSFTGQDVGLLSRLPIDEIERTDLLARGSADASPQSVSKNLVARFTLGGVPTTLIGVHFLARPSDPERLARRQGQAEVIRQVVVAEQAKGREVIVAGDLNDFDESIRDRNGNRPITDVLPRIKSAGDGPDDDLRNLIADVPQSLRFTALWDRNGNQRAEIDELSAIDHILVSAGLYRRIREVRYVHSHDPITVTDHFPIVVSFDSQQAN